MFKINDTVVITNGRYIHVKGVIEAITPNREAYIRFIGRTNWEKQADFVPLALLMHFEFNF